MVMVLNCMRNCSSAMGPRGSKHVFEIQTFQSSMYAVHSHYPDVCADGMLFPLPGVAESVKQLVSIAGDQIAIWLDGLHGAEVTDTEIFRCNLPLITLCSAWQFFGFAFFYGLLSGGTGSGLL